MKNALLKTTVWALAGVACHVVIRRPPRKPTQKDNIPKQDFLLKILHKIIPLYLLLSFVLTLTQIFTVQSSSFRRFTSYPSVCEAARIDTPFIASFIILSVSFLLRQSSFQTLGQMFSFEGTVKQDHKLVTSGPYRFVRHPTYTALFGLLVGYIGLHLSTCNSWAVRVLFRMWLIYYTTLLVKLGLRSREEDEMLRRKFGREWIEYSMRVPYRFIPWIL